MNYHSLYTNLAASLSFLTFFWKLSISVSSYYTPFQWLTWSFVVYYFVYLFILILLVTKLLIQFLNFISCKLWKHIYNSYKTLQFSIVSLSWLFSSSFSAKFADSMSLFSVKLLTWFCNFSPSAIVRPVGGGVSGVSWKIRRNNDNFTRSFFFL